MDDLILKTFVSLVKGLKTLENQSQRYISVQASAAEGNHLHRQNVTSLLSLSQVKHFMSLKRHQLFLPFDMAQEIEVDKLKRRWLRKTNVEMSPPLQSLHVFVLLFYP